MYENIFSHNILPSIPKAHTPDYINRLVEQAVRNSGYTTAVAQLNPLPRASLTQPLIQVIERLQPPPVHDNTLPQDAQPPPLTTHTLNASKRGKAPGFLSDSPDVLLLLRHLQCLHSPEETGATLTAHFLSLFLT
jgi:hypothetical protein